jgi:hypothetical protein
MCSFLVSWVVVFAKNALTTFSWKKNRCKTDINKVGYKRSLSYLERSTLTAIMANVVLPDVLSLCVCASHFALER